MRRLGRTGLTVSPIALGGAAFAYTHRATGWDPYSDAGKAVVHATLNAALDEGINLLDTAPAYGNGHSEALVGEVMKTRRKDCVLATKVWYELDRDGVTDSVHQSLRRLNTDHIDILQIHGRMYTPAEVVHINGPVMDALLTLKEAGKIGHIGITAEEPWTVIPFLTDPNIEVFQIAYNIIYQAAARHFLIEADKVNAGVVTMRTMTSGVFQREMEYLAPEWQGARDLFEVSLKFVLADSRVHSGIVGARWPEEVLKNIAMIKGWRPPVDFATMPRLTVEVYKAEEAER